LSPWQLQFYFQTYSAANSSSLKLGYCRHPCLHFRALQSCALVTRHLSGLSRRTRTSRYSFKISHCCERKRHDSTSMYKHGLHFIHEMYYSAITYFQGVMTGRVLNVVWVFNILLTYYQVACLRIYYNDTHLKSYYNGTHLKYEVNWLSAKPHIVASSYSNFC
jgi:hypothetical protein